MSAFPIISVISAAAVTSALFTILKYFERWKVDNLQGLTFNYLTASLLSFAITSSRNIALLPESGKMFWPAIFIGLLFICVFYITAMTAQKSGLAVASIASKMSMAIPIAVGVFLFGDSFTWLRFVGVLLALTAVAFSGAGKASEKKINTAASFLLPVLLFIGSGLVDTSIKLSQQYFLNPENTNLFFSFLFGTAGGFGVIALIGQIIKGKKITWRSLGAGIFLGSINYFSLYFLVDALSTPGAESSVIFSVMNMLIVIFSTITGMILFSEKPTRLNLAGLGLALVALLLLSY